MNIIKRTALAVFVLPSLAWPQIGVQQFLSRRVSAVQINRKQAPQPLWFKRLRELSPEQQERIMENDPRFQRLPPARQRLIRQRLAHWNSLTPQQRQRFRENEQTFELLRPEQRQQARSLFREWRQLPPDRRRAVNRAFLRLRNLPPERRARFLNSPSVQQRFSPRERALLSGLGQLLP